MEDIRYIWRSSNVYCIIQTSFEMFQIKDFANAKIQIKYCNKSECKRKHEMWWLRVGLDDLKQESCNAFRILSRSQSRYISWLLSLSTFHFKPFIAHWNFQTQITFKFHVLENIFHQDRDFSIQTHTQDIIFIWNMFIVLNIVAPGKRLAFLTRLEIVDEMR